MQPKLIEFVTINGKESEFSNQDNDIFSCLSYVQLLGHANIPELEQDWLQTHPEFVKHLQRLFTVGHTTIFSLTEKYEIKIKWAWRKETEPENEVFKSPEMSGPLADLAAALAPDAEESRSEAAETANEGIFADDFPIDENADFELPSREEEAIERTKDREFKRNSCDCAIMSPVAYSGLGFDSTEPERI